MGGRCLLYLFTCDFPARFARRPAHVELIGSPFYTQQVALFFPLPSLLSLLHSVLLLPSCLPISTFFFPLLFIIYFCSFLPACRTGWVFLPSCASVSSCANFSLWLSPILQLLLSLHLSPSLYACLFLVPSYFYSLVILHSLLSLPLRTSF